MGVSSRILSRWYVQLATSLEAGLPLERSIGAAQGPPPARKAELQARLMAGDGVGEALERGGAWLPSIDRQLMAAGSQAGRLPDVVRRLAARHDEASRAALRAMAGALYPIFVLHLGAVALPLSEFFNGGGLSSYVSHVAWVLVPLWTLVAVVGLGVYLRWAVVGFTLNTLPFVGGSRRFQALADLSFVLEAQLVAGIRLDVAWLQAAVATGDRRLERVAIAAAEAVQRGEPVGPVLLGRRELPPPFVDFYMNGEQTGRLDEGLQHLQREFLGRAKTRLQIAAVAYPTMLLVGVGAWVMTKYVVLWLNHIRELESFH